MSAYILNITMPNYGSAMPYCQDCGEEISEDVEICPKCGTRIIPKPPEKKNVLLATVVSLILPGFGQLYLGKLAKGLMFMALAVGLGWKIHFSLATVVQVFSAYDAYKLAKEYNDRVEHDLKVT